MNKDKFANLTRGEIARKFISPEQRFAGRVFRQRRGRREKAFSRFFRSARLKKETLQAYKEIARRVTDEKLDKNGVQALRLELVEKALGEF